MTADETTTSAFRSSNGSDLVLSTQGSKWSQLSQQPKHHSPLFQASRPSLVDRLPIEKLLNKTIILNNGYDFGGLVGDRNAIQTSPSVELVREEKGSWKDWNNSLRGLLEEEPSDMKESIHCSPDVRKNSFECEMLRGFGREIKESIMDA